MAKYKSFKHVVRYDSDDGEGILCGKCNISYKLDGTNSVLWWDDDTDTIGAGSRTRKLSETKDNAGFYAWANSNNAEAEILRNFLCEHPQYIIYGEFGVGQVAHIKDYNADARNYLWIFDMFDFQEDHYLADEVWRPMLEEAGAGQWIIPIAATIENPTPDQLAEIAKNNKFLLDNANHPGEGVVIRNINFRNKYGHYEIGKLVLDEYKQNKAKPKKVEYVEGEVEQAIVDTYLTDAELSKTMAKVVLACGADAFDNKNGKMVGMFLNWVMKECVLEECATWIKKFRNPVVNFSLLDSLVKAKARKYIGF